MKLARNILFATLTAVSTAVCEAKTFAETLEASYTIDDLLESEYKKMGIEPNSVVDDGTFVRRAYLNIIGRIPTA